ncbi:MAG: bifunctional diaminohydroxyphosphoribosylaminopyrimidine deaminase/5-amino-6-(5-phosphoribosylamino)uracil reductase RibD [Candidatus Nanopelagicales bacterium]
MPSDTFMARAIELASKVDLSRDINPTVGAVIVDASGNVVGEGWHNGSGTDHAEVMAIAQAGAKAVGATLYCTLEPCNAQGKTGPCAQAVIAAGITKVVIAQADPHRAMSGGVKTLQAAGIEVEVGLLQDSAIAINASWNFAQENNRPWVIWKTATTLDGFVAAEDGSSKWITGEPARERVQEIRASVGAILTGTGTVLADDPLLTVRALSDDQQPLRVIVGDRELPANSQIFTGTNPAIRMGGDLSKVIAELWQEHGVHKVLVEAGSHVSQSLWSANLVDEVYWFQAPMILGSGKPAIGSFGVNTLANASRFPEYQVDRVGLDLLVHFTTR